MATGRRALYRLPMNAPTYRTADPADAEALAGLFSETFCEIFGHLYQSADLAAFLADHTPVHWREQLADTALAIRIAEQEGALVGFAKLGPLKLPVEADRPALELRQLYVAPQVRGGGVAVALMDWIVGQAVTRGAEELYLSVYTDNPRAQRFYARYGFVEVGPYAFMVGNHADEDIIMKAPLGRAVAGEPRVEPLAS